MRLLWRSTPTGTALDESVWQRWLGRGNSIAVHGDRVYVTGFVSGAFGDHTFYGERDLFIAAFDTEGTLVWSDQVGTPLTDKGAAVLADDIDRVVVAGYTNGSLAGSAGEFDIVLQGYADDWRTVNSNLGRAVRRRGECDEANLSP